MNAFRNDKVTFGVDIQRFERGCLKQDWRISDSSARGQKTCFAKNVEAGIFALQWREILGSYQDIERVVHGLVLRIPQPRLKPVDAKQRIMCRP